MATFELLVKCNSVDELRNFLSASGYANSIPVAPATVSNVENIVEENVLQEPVKRRGRPSKTVETPAETVPPSVFDEPQKSVALDDTLAKLTVPTVVQVQDALTAYRDRFGMPKVFELLKKYDAVSIKYLKEDQRADFITAIKQELAA